MPQEGSFVCKLCRGSTHSRRYCLRAPNQAEFSVIVCAECGLFQDEYDWSAAPALRVITQFDDATQQALWGSEAEIAAHKRKGTALAEVLNQIVEVKNKRVLDIGCGDGYFLEAVRNLGAAHVAGQEFRNVDIQHARERAGIGDVRAVPFSDRATWPDAEFDIVCSADVVEHVHDLKNFFDDCVRLAKPDGVIFHATPGCDAVTHRFGRMLARVGIRGLAATLCNVQPPGDLLGGSHVSIMGRRQVEWLCARHTLRLLDFRYVNSYTYSDEHYAALLPVLRRLPSAMAKRIFAGMRETVWNKLVFAVVRK